MVFPCKMWRIWVRILFFSPNSRDPNHSFNWLNIYNIKPPKKWQLSTDYCARFYFKAHLVWFETFHPWFCAIGPRIPVMSFRWKWILTSMGGPWKMPSEIFLYLTSWMKPLIIHVCRLSRGRVFLSITFTPAISWP